MGQVPERIAPEPVVPELHGPAVAAAVAEIEVRDAPALQRPTGAARRAVFEALGREQLAQDAVRAIELTQLPQRTVGEEIHGVLTVAHRQLDRVPPPGVGRIHGHQLPAAIRFDRPPRRQLSHVLLAADERRADERRVGEGQAADLKQVRARGDAVPNAHLPEP